MSISITPEKLLFIYIFGHAAISFNLNAENSNNSDNSSNEENDFYTCEYQKQLPAKRGVITADHLLKE